MTSVAERAVDERSWIDRMLSPFSEVHAGEGLSALLIAFNIFLLLTFGAIIKIIRDALLFTEGGAELGSYSAAGQAAVLLFLVPAYGAFASRVNRLRLICGVTLFFASHLVVFFLLGQAGVKVGIPFYIWAGVFNVMVIAQLWAFANDLYTSERGKRIFPLINLGASLGGVVGAGFATVYLNNVGAYTLLLMSAVGLAMTIVLTIWVHRRERTAAGDLAGARAQQPLGKQGGFKLVLQERYLFLIACLIMVLNLVNTLGGFILSRLIRAEALAAVAPGTAVGDLTEVQTEALQVAIGTMVGEVNTTVNILAFLLGAFVVSRVLKYIGVRGALFVLPLIAFVSYSTMALVPLLSVVRIGKILENGTDYSIQNTARHSLFLPTSREAKYKAKQAIDTFFWRAGDVLQAGVVFVGLQYLQFDVQQFAMVNVVLVAIWIGLVIAIGREHRKLDPVDSLARAA